MERRRSYALLPSPPGDGESVGRIERHVQHLADLEGLTEQTVVSAQVIRGKQAAKVSDVSFEDIEIIRG